MKEYLTIIKQKLVIKSIKQTGMCFNTKTKYNYKI